MSDTLSRFTLLTVAQVFSIAEAYGLNPQEWKEYYHGERCPMFCFTQTLTMRTPYGYGEKNGVRDSIRDILAAGLLEIHDDGSGTFTEAAVEAVHSLTQACRDGAFGVRDDDGAPLLSPDYLEHIAATYEQNAAYLKPRKRSGKNAPRKSGKSSAIQSQSGAVRSYLLNAQAKYVPLADAIAEAGTEEAARKIAVEAAQKPRKRS